MEYSRSRKPVILGVAVGIAVIVFGLWLFNYLTVGWVSIYSNNPSNKISLSSASQPYRNYTGTGSLKKKLKRGLYTAVISSASGQVRQVVRVGAHRDSTYTISLDKLTGAEPVISQNAQAVTTDDSLVFLNNGTHQLNKVDSRDKVSVLSPMLFQSVVWGSSNFGVGQDSNGVLYTITSGVVKKMAVPFAYDGQLVRFDVAPDKTVVVSHGEDVYSAMSGSNFAQVYTATSDEPVISAGASVMAVANASTDENTTQKPLLAVISSGGRVVKKGIVAHRLSWSPSGKYLLDEDATATIYDPSLNQVSKLPDSAIIGSVRWIDDSTILYSKNDQLWKYSIPDQKAAVLANMPLGGYITSISTSQNSSYAYLTTTNSGSAASTAIRRVGLKGQSVPLFIFQLQSILPLTTGGCDLSLVNFSSPAVIVRPTTASCLMEAETTLKNRGFNLSSFSVGF